MIEYIQMPKKIEYRKWEQVNGLPIKEYSTTKEGKHIVIYPKNPVVHTSNHPLDDEPTFFYNLEQIIQHPHRTITRKSNNPQAILNRKKGKVITYVRDNFINELSIPGYVNWTGDEVRVVTMFEDSGENYTETYIIIKK